MPAITLAGADFEIETSAFAWTSVSTCADVLAPGPGSFVELETDAWFSRCEPSATSAFTCAVTTIVFVVLYATVPRLSGLL